MLSEEIRRKQIDFIDKICHEIRNPINGQSPPRDEHAAFTRALF